MCTVLLRVSPDAPWPVLLGAIRDEFADRAWDPPAAHWDDRWPGLLGGRDRTAGGTWLAVDPDPDRPAVAALLNGARRPAPAEGTRPTRGTLALEVLTSGHVPSGDEVRGYDGFHLLLATLDGTQVWSWDGEELCHRDLDHGDHIVVNLGVDAADDPLIPHFAPLLAELPDPLLDGDPTTVAWEPWTDLLGGDGLDGDDPRALLVRRDVDGRTYESTSASLVALGPGRVRYDFCPIPTDPTAWWVVTDR
ncbi:MAG TPA: NRDE family protein [Acidimicrobiales bacterium]|nr:NRDE family protein [Acidimicrobiales bacterium]